MGRVGDDRDAQHAHRSCRATITSGTVDMPTASAPMPRRKRYLGPRLVGSARRPRRRRPRGHAMPLAPERRALRSADQCRSYGSHMSRKRTPSSGSSFGPISGFWRPAHQVDVVARDHHVARGVLRVQAAGGVGDDQHLGAQALHHAAPGTSSAGGCSPRRSGPGPRITATGTPSSVPAHELAGVRRPPSRRRSAGSRAYGTMVGVRDLVGQRPEARAEDDPDARHDREAASQAGGRLPDPVRQRG